MDTQLTPQGLSFNIQIGTEERRSEIHELAGGEHDVDEVFSDVGKLRPYTTIILNPQKYSAKRLLKIFCDGQKSLAEDESISISHGLPKKYQREWLAEKTDDGPIEGQQLVVVAFSETSPVGFAGFNITLRHERKEKQVSLSHEILLVYVQPGQRGKGYGMDLSVACSFLCQDILEATYRAVPPKYTIIPTMSADFTSTGGERFTQQLASGLEYRADMLQEYGRRRSIAIETLSVDAGY